MTRLASGNSIVPALMARRCSVCTLATCTSSSGRGWSPGRMMPCGIPRSLLLVWVMISRRWARNSEPQALLRACSTIARAITVLPDRGRRDHDDPALPRLDRAPEFGDHLGLVRAQHLGHGAPRDLGCCIPAPRPLRMVARTLCQPSSAARPFATQACCERRDHLGLGELAAGDQLKQAEGGAVERVRYGEPGGVAASAAISARRAAWP